jgi:hypothetical protein
MLDLEHPLFLDVYTRQDASPEKSRLIFLQNLFFDLRKFIFHF